MSPKKNFDKLRLSALLMILAIVGAAAFQGYWFKKLYTAEWSELKKETDITFRDVLYKLQLQRFRSDTAFSRHVPDNLFVFNMLDSVRSRLIDTADAGPGRAGDGSAVGRARRLTVSITTDGRHDSAGRVAMLKKMITLQGFPPPSSDGPLPFILKYISSTDTVTSALSIGKIDSAYKKELLRSKIEVPYTIQQLQGSEHDLDKPVPLNELKTSFLFVGLSKAYAYQATFGSPFGYIMNRLKLQFLMGLLLLLFTTASFVFLYRNLRQQQRLAAIKNEFISNMTHELKTPISTVKVAVEALRHFDALDDPQRTREYLDISALELQRLSMLVDKVLKLSLFENKEIELNTTTVDVFELAAEVIASMKLQLDKAGVFVQLTSSGDRFLVKADRTHLSSVLSNLLDNALKYCKAAPAITIHLVEEIGPGAGTVGVVVSDNGIGIPAAYLDRIFEKFFRVPSGDHHNIKGYGLGLSYVHHIVTKHQGVIAVESREGKGTVFTIKLPAA
jgi:two-component system phosphate regulon sensor histidine kinase PhoR